MPTSLRPYAGLQRQPTPNHSRLRDALQSDALVDGARAFAEQRDPPPAPTNWKGADTDDAGKARDDRQTQAYLLPLDPTEGRAVDAGGVQSAAGPATLFGDRFVRTLDVEVADGVSAGAKLAPTSTSVQTGWQAGDAAMTGSAIGGSATKGVKATVGAGGLGLGVGVNLQITNKIVVLGPTRPGPGGETLHLARFSTSLAPNLDLDLAATSGLFQAAARLVVSWGHATTYEKYLPAPDLARLMRVRDHWYRNLVEFSLATRLCGGDGVRAPAMSVLAHHAAQVDDWLPGERATWRSSRALVLGLAGGMVGARAVATATISGATTYTLLREDTDHVVLSVEPSATAGVRLSVEAKAVADLGVDWGVAGRQRRAWRFNTDYMASRHALSRALRGELPGILLPADTDPVQAALSLTNLHARESLPVGVEHVASDFAHQSALTLRLGSIRLPELLGGSALFRQMERADSLAGVTDGTGTTLTRSSSRSTSSGLLSWGSLSSGVSVALTSAAEHGPRGEPIVTSQGLTLTHEVATTDSHLLGRRRVAAGLSRTTGLDVQLQDAQPTKGYKARFAFTLDREGLEAAAAVTDVRLAELAAQREVPLRTAQSLRQMARTFLADGKGRHATGPMRALARHGYRGMELFNAMAGQELTPLITIKNASHDALLRDFLKAEIYAQGARTRDHATRAAERTQKLLVRLDAAIVEVKGDGLLRHADEELTDQQVALLEALRDETQALARDLATSLA